MLKNFTFLIAVLVLGVGAVHAQESKKLTFRVVGSCEDCGHAALEGAIVGLPGMSSFGWADKTTISIQYNPKQTNEQQLIADLVEAGYRVNGQGSGCCVLGDPATTSVNTQDFNDEDDDPVTKDEEALGSIDNAKADAEKLDVNEATTGETRAILDKAEAEADAESESITASVDAVRQEDEKNLDKEADDELEQTLTKTQD